MKPLLLGYCISVWIFFPVAVGFYIKRTGKKLLDEDLPTVAGLFWIIVWILVPALFPILFLYGIGEGLAERAARREKKSTPTP